MEQVGEYGHREPTGYFRLMMPNAKALPLRVTMRQSLHEAHVRANITAAGDGGGGTPLLSFRLFVDASSLTNNGTAMFLTIDYQSGYEPVLEWVPCSSSGNSVGCGPAAINATRNVTKDGVALSVHTVKFGSGNMSWASGWRWLDTSSSSASTNDDIQSKTAVVSIAACNTPACIDGSLGALCPCVASSTASLHDGDSEAASGVDPAHVCADAVNTAATRGVEAAFAAHKGWWADYWVQSFVSLPVTRIEGYYYSQMYRFPSSDRIGLHGLMGAFGPSGMFSGNQCIRSHTKSFNLPLILGLFRQLHSLEQVCSTYGPTTSGT